MRCHGKVSGHRCIVAHATTALPASVTVVIFERRLQSLSPLDAKRLPFGEAVPCYFTFLLFAVAVTLLSLPTALHTAVVAAAVSTAV